MRILALFLILLSSVFAFAQEEEQDYNLKGVITDASSGDPLIGANVVFADNPGKGTAADLDGNFNLNVKPGNYKLIISYVGYKSKTVPVKVGDKPVNLDISLKSQMLDEVEVVADVAIDRKTPVAFMNIKESKITEELAGRDLPMLLNTTPGVYATQQGGGEGDAEIKMRGFDGRFVGVLLDGIPVNDMENGTVYWSNWFGLSSVTRTIQSQRGLGSSKLAIPSIGGTINILTKGIDNKRSFTIKEGIDQFGKTSTTAGFNSGELKNGWSVTLAGSYKTGGSWVDAMTTDAYFYFAKVNKRIKNHTLSFTTYGAPQEHIQRSDKLRIVMFDKDYADRVGVPDSVYPSVIDQGIGFNRNWGYLRRTRDNPDAEAKKFFMNRNDYFKPMFYLKDFWSISDKLTVYNIAYASIGRGGGISGITEQDGTGYTMNYDDATGQADIQSRYDANTTYSPYTGGYPIDSTYSNTDFFSRYVVRKSRNDHLWYGYLGNISYQPSEVLTFDVGLDARGYEGTHYAEVDDLLGGDYFLDDSDQRVDYSANPKAAMRKEGDKFLYYSTSFAKWGGTYFQGEYSTPVYSALINVTGSLVNYKKDDYYADTASEGKNFYGWTVKGGFNYNASERINLFVNGGYYDKVQMLSYVFSGFTVDFNDAVDNEKIKSIELGFQYKTTIFSARVNGYFTRWENTVRRISSPEDGNWYNTYAGLDADHKGVEFDFTLKPIKNLEVKGWMSLGDWRWDSKYDELSLYRRTGGSTIDEIQISFDVRDIYVGGAAQTQFGGQVRYEPIKGLYGSLTGTFFDRYYADFEPENSLDEAGNPRQPWETPSYTLFDFHAGYKFPFPWYKKVQMSVGLNLLNMLDARYITAAQNNAEVLEGGAPGEQYNAASAAVFFGPPRRIMLSLGIKF